MDFSPYWVIKFPEFGRPEGATNHYKTSRDFVFFSFLLCLNRFVHFVSRPFNSSNFIFFVLKYKPSKMKTAFLFKSAGAGLPEKSTA